MIHSLMLIDAFKDAKLEKEKELGELSAELQRVRVRPFFIITIFKEESVGVHFAVFFVFVAVFYGISFQKELEERGEALKGMETIVKEKADLVTQLQEANVSW